MSTQRKAWNEAMRSAGAVLPPSSGSGTSGAPSRRESIASRSRRKRRENARKSSLGAAGGSGSGGINALEEKEYRVALHMDILEGVVDNTVGGDDDDEYDEFAELNDDEDDNKKKKRKRKSVGAAKKKKGKASAIPKYLKARSLASILIEEASRSDSVAKQYVDASVRRLASDKQATTTSDTTTTTTTISTTTYTNPYPARKFCPVTGLYGEYTEPKTGISYASLSALEQIRERPPPWMNVGSSTSASYWEAVKSLQNR